jgi:predicted nuclease with TOPRIM domain
MKQLATIANETIEQIQFFLGLDESATRNLVSEIRREPDVTEKCAKLIHLLVDRLSDLSIQINSHELAIGQLYDDIRRRMPVAPSDRSKFLAWIPRQMERYLELIQSFQDRLRTCKERTADEWPDPKLRKGRKRSPERHREADVTHAGQKVATFSDDAQNVALAEENESLKAELDRLQSEFQKREGTLRREQQKREQKFNRLKSQLTEYGNELLRKEQEMMESITPHDVQDGLHLQVKTLSANLTSSQSECESLRHELGACQADRDALKAENDTLHAQVQFLMDRVKHMEGTNHEKSSELESTTADQCRKDLMLRQKGIQLDQLVIKARDFQAHCERLKGELDQMRKQNKDLLHERIRLETELLKVRDELARATSKLSAVEEDGMTLQRFGFALADAMCQHFNPKNARTELQRLLAVARAEHSELHETTRMQLDPVGAFAVETGSAGQLAYYSRFDELDREIAALHMSRSRT